MLLLPRDAYASTRYMLHIMYMSVRIVPSYDCVVSKPLKGITHTTSGAICVAYGLKFSDGKDFGENRVISPARERE